MKVDAGKLDGRHGVARGFTLIEIMVVIGIIVILVAIATVVAVEVKAKGARSGTLATLTTLKQTMDKYRGANNREPVVAANLAPGSVPDTTVWVQMLMADPDSAKSLGSIAKATQGTGVVIMDGWGKAIGYVPGDQGALDPRAAFRLTKKEGYFQSAGQDGTFNTAGDLYSSGQ